jgi:hypothetical protein
MELDYRLAEHVVLVTGSVEEVDDRFGDPDERASSADATIALAVRGDEGAGLRTLRLSERGDNDITVELTSDLRLTSVSHKSVGVGTKVLSAGVSVISTIAGLAIRAGVGGGGSVGALGVRNLLTREAEPTHVSPADREKAARAVWEVANSDLAAHQTSYRNLLARTRTKLLAERTTIVDGDPDQVAAAVVRVNRLEAVAADCAAEVEKVELLYKAWREAQRTRTVRHLACTLEVGSLVVAGPDTPPDPATLTGTAKALWDDMGVIVTVTPADGRGSTTWTAQDAPAPDPSTVFWRVPRPVKLCTWRIDADEKPVLDRVEEVQVVDVHSQVVGRSLGDRFFGSEEAGIVFGPDGAPTKLSSSDISAAGALADALGGLGTKVAEGLDTASKISTTAATLSDANAKRRLDALTTEHALVSKRLELDGLDATAADFAEAKRLEQQVAMAKATGELAGPSELSRLQNQLALETARRDLEAVARSRALDTELAAAQAEIQRLTTQLALEKARTDTE